MLNLCKFLGVEENEMFHLKKDTEVPKPLFYRITDNCLQVSSDKNIWYQSKVQIDNIMKGIVKCSEYEAHLTEEDYLTLLAIRRLFKNLANYIARDADGMLYIYQDKPMQFNQDKEPTWWSGGGWYTKVSGDCLLCVHEYLTEPFNIDEEIKKYERRKED